MLILQSVADFKNNTSLTSQHASSVLDIATNRSKRVDELYMNAFIASNLLNTMKNDVKNATKFLSSNEVATLPSNVQALSLDATNLTNNLMALFQSTLPVDDELLNRVQAYVNGIEADDLTQVKHMLQGDLLIYTDQLSTITAELESIEHNINTLTTILESLPDNCDSDLY